MIESSTPYMHIYTNTYTYGTRIYIYMHIWDSPPGKGYDRVVYPLYVYVYKHIQIWDSYIHMYTNFEFTTGKKVYNRVVLPPPLYTHIYTYIQIWDSYIHVYPNMGLTPGEKSTIESSYPLYKYVYKYIRIWDSCIHIYTNMGLTPGEKSKVESSTPYIHIYTNIYTYGTHICIYIQIWDSLPAKGL